MNAERSTYVGPGCCSKWCYAGDGGRSSGLAVQAGSPNHREVRRSKAVRAERHGKRRAYERVRYDPMKANESKPLMTCRNELDDIKTGSVIATRDEPGGSLLIGQVVSGMKAARAWVRLLHGTWEPALRYRGQRNGSDAHWSRKRDVQVAETTRIRVAKRNVRGGPSGSSDEGPVMGLERSGRTGQPGRCGCRWAVDRGFREGPFGEPISNLESAVIRDVYAAAGKGSEGAEEARAGGQNPRCANSR